MPVTKNYEFPLYDPEDSPDLTLTGREAAAIVAIDEALKTEETGRIEGDAGLNAALEKEATERKVADKVLTDDLAKEVTDRKAADTALSKRIDNAETEISANSADLTGIKGLTYGDNHVAFLENNNGEYDSPALQEIAEKVASGDLNVAIYGTTTFEEVKATLPNVVCKIDKKYAHLGLSDDNQIKFYTLGEGPSHTIYTVRNNNMWATATVPVEWGYIGSKPFNTVGNGLITKSKSLSLDTTYLPTVSAGPGVTVTPTTDGNHTKYEIASTGGASTGGTNVSVSTGTGTAYTGLTVTPTADGDTTRYDIALNAASKTARGGVTVGSGLNVNTAGIVSVDTAALPTLSPSAGILIDTSTSGGRTLYTVQAKVDEKTIGYNDDDQLTVLSTSTGGITGNTTWSELES